jgi:hypothetical protein
VARRKLAMEVTPLCLASAKIRSLNSTCDLARRAKAVSLRETGKKKNGNSHIVGFFS